MTYDPNDRAKHFDLQRMLDYLTANGLSPAGRATAEGFMLVLNDGELDGNPTGEAGPRRADEAERGPGRRGRDRAPLVLGGTRAAHPPGDCLMTADEARLFEFSPMAYLNSFTGLLATLEERRGGHPPLLRHQPAG
jgi:hypothetical protein